MNQPLPYTLITHDISPDLYIAFANFLNMEGTWWDSGCFCMKAMKTQRWWVDRGMCPGRITNMFFDMGRIAGKFVWIVKVAEDEQNHGRS